MLKVQKEARKEYRADEENKIVEMLAKSHGYRELAARMIYENERMSALMKRDLTYVLSRRRINERVNSTDRLTTER